jgi:predicted alpha/beta superfamily hydrolase
MAMDPIITNEPASAPPGSLPLRLHKHDQFLSRMLETHHDLLVYVPPGYASSQEQRYPVLYMQDGQNLFDPETSFIPGNYWRLGETADALIASGHIEPLLIVGIYNTGVRRIDEYTPVADRRLGGGHADAYGRMMVEELKPFIDGRYRTLPGGEHCGIGGSSLGGLVSLYLGLQYPLEFSRLAVLSPSIWWRNRAILKTVALPGEKPALKIWLDMGTKESARAIAEARLLREALISKGWRQGEDLAYNEVEGGEHTESAWAERVDPMLRFLYPAGPTRP